MRPVSLRLEDIENMLLVLGFVGENEHTRVRFDAKKMYDQYPNGIVSLSVTPPEGESYPAVIERDGDMVIWDIVDSNLTAEGSGEYQLTFTQEPHVAKTYVGKFKVKRSIVPTGNIPSGLDDFITRAGAALEAIPEEIAAEFGAILVVAETLPAGSSATASFDPETMTLTIGIPEGGKGDPGDPGYSPTASVSKSGDEATITITDKNGTTTAKISDGDDGYSPTATVTKSGKTATITITDKNGTTTAQISDGQDGQGADIIDDTAGTGDTDKTFSADKLSGEFTQLMNEINDLIEVSDTQPTDEANVLWIVDGGAASYSVPTVAEMNTALAEKLDKPVTAGTNGQVLTSDGNGGQSWQTPGGGGSGNVPSGGTTGQFLVKASSTDYDCEWVTVPAASGVSF